MTKLQKTKHTGWELGEISVSLFYATDVKTGRKIAEFTNSNNVLNEEVGDRMEATWNACKGISNEALESGVIGEMVSLIETIAKGGYFVHTTHTQAQTILNKLNVAEADNEKE